MIKSTFINAHAKINLLLDITGSRPDDGYHLIESVFQTVSLHDRLIVTVNDNGGFIRVRSSCRTAPNGMKNIAYKAAAAFFEYTGDTSHGADIFINKVIPSQAGLGGGSSDAASVLMALNHLLETNLSNDVLCEIGAGLGADVPFFIMGGTVHVSGIGEILRPLKPIPQMQLVIAKGAKGISTREAYSKIDTLPSLTHPDIDAMLSAIQNSDIKSIAENSMNIFDEVTDIPDIDFIKKTMLKNGALCAVMSGSGSAVFGIFESSENARMACDSLSQTVSFAKVCTTC